MYSKGACNVRRYGATEAWVQIRAQMDGRTDGRTDEWTDGRTDAQMDGGREQNAHVDGRIKRNPPKPRS